MPGNISLEDILGFGLRVQALKPEDLDSVLASAVIYSVIWHETLKFSELHFPHL